LVAPSSKLKVMNSDMQPQTLDETYEKLFGPFPAKKGKGADADLRKVVAKNMLSCIDVRLFGGTYAGKTNLSIHGPVQITHGVNRYEENAIYSEQIMSPFRNPGDKSADSTQSTLGSQYKLQEGHYVHHFSVNPHNLDTLTTLSKGQGLSIGDIEKLKEGLSRGCTFYDSAAKAGTENELMLWIELKIGSKLVLPSFVNLITIGEDRVIDFTKVNDLLSKENVKKHIEKIELYIDSNLTKIKGIPATTTKKEIYQ